jgi:hypothetical protein
MRVLRLLLVGSVLLFAVHAIATIFGSVQGLIHDPQHRPVKGAQVTIHSVSSDWRQTATSDDQGEFQFMTVPVGEYMVMVQSAGFADQQQNIEITSDRNVKLHYALTVANTRETVQVTDTAPLVNTESSTTQSVVSRQQITQTPGADQSNSLAMITDYTPSAYMVHDQLHIRGGHQVSWLIDGVPVPNTSIASNVGPQFDPKDIDYLEVQRGGYSADYGDRTYGVFNVVTRSGFERDRQGELVLGYGSYNNTNDQISFGDHSERFAYYGSFSGYRTDLGLETPTTDVIHDQGAGLSGFGSIIFNKSPQDQFRLVTSLRGDHYQVPIDPNASDILHDAEDERDDFVNFSWLHNLGTDMLLTISPFYHFNRAHYVSSPDDPVQSEYDRGSNFAGGVATIGVTKRKHNFRAGLQVFGERDNQFYQVVDTTPGSPDAFAPQRTMPWANVETLFLEDQFRATSWLTFNAGVRMTHYAGPESENAADPRIGAAIRIPHLEWVLRGFYGRYYQAPPLVTVTDPALNADQTFLPLRGERDEQHEIGLAIPIKRWTLDLSNFRTTAKNFFDHDVLGNSNVFFPLTLERARIRGSEATINSPLLADRIKFHLAYSNQFAEWSGGITGGLTDFSECDGVLCFLDHDQRNTLSTGFNTTLPWRAWMDFNLNFGSGFLNGEGDDDPTHLDPHTTFDLSLGKSFGENFEARVTALNLSNHHYMLDNSNTFGGTHFANPREISFQIKYRFHF